MTLAMHHEKTLIWQGRYEGPEALWQTLARLPGTWTLTVQPHRTPLHPRFPARAALLLASALADLGWGLILHPDRGPDRQGRYRELIYQHLWCQEWPRLPLAYQFRITGPSPYLAPLTLYTGALLLAQGESARPYRLPATYELTRALAARPDADAMTPLLTALDRYGDDGTLGFRRQGRPPTTSPERRRELGRLRIQRFRQRHRAQRRLTGRASPSPNG